MRSGTRTGIRGQLDFFGAFERVRRTSRCGDVLLLLRFLSQVNQTALRVPKTIRVPEWFINHVRSVNVVRMRKPACSRCAEHALVPAFSVIRAFQPFRNREITWYAVVPHAPACICVSPQHLKTESINELAKRSELKDYNQGFLIETKLPC
jgi:hypothetical protein